ncbi:hypothetical protein QQ056_14350 [Oscillatoria laete-virens NRMC-F 0139]|nr:hypothetical protein [Oscillatoria laete-virens NRMC-F 0139]
MAWPFPAMGMNHEKMSFCHRFVTEPPFVCHMASLGSAALIGEQFASGKLSNDEKT